MKIVRDGKGYELTAEELAAASAEFVTNFMKSELMGRCKIPDEELAEELAEQAYDRYIVKETARQKENVSTGRIIPDSNLQKKNNHAA